MKAKCNPKIAICLVLLAWSLVACTGEQPKMIGSYPAQAEPLPLAQLPRSAPQPAAQFVYETWITLEAARVETTAERAMGLAERCGGYLESSHSWQQDRRTYMTLVLAVPAASFDALRADLLDLGTLQNERVSGEWVYPGGGWSYYTRITLTLQPRGVVSPDWSIAGWNPGRTFRQALEVFVSIFGFLMDVLIWVVVVLGPFALIALGVRALWRKVH